METVTGVTTAFDVGFYAMERLVNDEGLLQFLSFLRTR